MANSILLETKKVLGLPEAYTPFDTDVLMHINTALGTLNQLGIGPEDGFEVVDQNAEWDQLLEGNKKLNPVKTYVYLKVRVFYDPPEQIHLLQAMERQIEQLEWRLNVVREDANYIPPNLTPEDDEEILGTDPDPTVVVFDGGSP